MSNLISKYLLSEVCIRNSNLHNTYDKNTISDFFKSFFDAFKLMRYSNKKFYVNFHFR